MRTAKKTVPTLDLFRLAAVLLVVMNHTSPLADVSAMADFWLTRVLARVAVPFFLMTTGYFLSRNHWAGVGRQLKKLCLLYGVCILFVSASESLCRQLHRSGGCFAETAGGRHLLPPVVFPGDHSGHRHRPVAQLAACGWLCLWRRYLYLIGLGGDSYYGLVSQIPLLRTPLRRHFNCAAIPAMACSSRHCSFCLGPPEGSGTKSCLWRASSPPRRLGAQGGGAPVTGSARAQHTSPLCWLGHNFCLCRWAGKWALLDVPTIFFTPA